MSNSGGPGGSSAWEMVIRVITVVLAIVILACLAILIIFLLGQANAEDPIWQRYIYLLSGVEAIAFAAAGYLFGREVNRGRAEEAQRRADNAETRVEGAETRAKQEAERAQTAVAVADQNTHAATAYKERFEALKSKIEQMSSRYDRPRSPELFPGTLQTGAVRGSTTGDQRRISLWMGESVEQGEKLADGAFEDLGLLATTQNEREALQKDVDELAALVSRPDEIEIRTLPTPETGNQY